MATLDLTNLGDYLPKLTPDEYQDRALETAIYPESAAIIYPALGLASEAGEIAGKVKKAIRDSGGEFSDAMRAALADELGDCLWYIAVLADDLDYNLSEVMENNLRKLEDRARRGVIGGSGDNR